MSLTFDERQASSASLLCLLFLSFSFSSACSAPILFLSLIILRFLLRLPPTSVIFSSFSFPTFSLMSWNSNSQETLFWLHCVFFLLLMNRSGSTMVLMIFLQALTIKWISFCFVFHQREAKLRYRTEAKPSVHLCYLTVIKTRWYPREIHHSFSSFFSKANFQVFRSKIRDLVTVFSTNQLIEKRFITSCAVV